MQIFRDKVSVLKKALTFQDLPVIVWIYGGGYMTGSSSLEVYDPRQIVTYGKVIFVTLQYRVGSHGFLYMGADSSAPGNVGLLDQVQNMINLP